MNDIDLGRAFKAPFETENWLATTGLALVWGLLGILFFPLLAIYNGAQLEYIRRVSRGDHRLPDWSEFGSKWVQGLMVWLAGFIYFLPVIVLAALVLLPVATSAASGNDEALAGALVGGSCLFIVIAVVYTAVVSIFFSAATVHYAMTGSFGAFFDFGGIMGRVRGGTGYFTAWLYSIVISFAVQAVSGLVSSITAGIGGILALPLTFLSLMMVGHVFGQWAARAYGVVAAPVGYGTGGPGGYVPPAPPAYQPPQPSSQTPPPAPPVYDPPAPPAYAPPQAPPAPPAAPEAGEAPTTPGDNA